MAAQTLDDIIIRLAVRDDVPGIKTLIEQFVASGDVLPRTLEEVEYLLPTFFVAEMGGEVVGCVTLEVYSWKLAEVRSLCVSLKAQGRGVGTRLVQACVDLARERGILEVMAITRSEDFFRACGFDYTLPSLKKALFLQTHDDSANVSDDED